MCILKKFLFILCMLLLVPFVSATRVFTDYFQISNFTQYCLNSSGLYLCHNSYDKLQSSGFNIPTGDNFVYEDIFSLKYACTVINFTNPTNETITFGASAFSQKIVTEIEDYRSPPFSQDLWQKDSKIMDKMILRWNMTTNMTYEYTYQENYTYWKKFIQAGKSVESGKTLQLALCHYRNKRYVPFEEKDVYSKWSLAYYNGTANEVFIDPFFNGASGQDSRATLVIGNQNVSGVNGNQSWIGDNYYHETFENYAQNFEYTDLMEAGANNRWTASSDAQSLSTNTTVFTEGASSLNILINTSASTSNSSEIQRVLIQDWSEITGRISGTPIIGYLSFLVLVNQSEDKLSLQSDTTTKGRLFNVQLNTNVNASGGTVTAQYEVFNSSFPGRENVSYVNFTNNRWFRVLMNLSKPSNSSADPDNFNWTNMTRIDINIGNDGLAGDNYSVFIDNLRIYKTYPSLSGSHLSDYWSNDGFINESYRGIWEVINTTDENGNPTYSLSQVVNDTVDYKFLFFTQSQNFSNYTIRTKCLLRQSANTNCGITFNWQNRSNTEGFTYYITPTALNFSIFNLSNQFNATTANTSSGTVTHSANTWYWLEVQNNGTHLTFRNSSNGRDFSTEFISRERQFTNGSIGVYCRGGCYIDDLSLQVHIANATNTNNSAGYVLDNQNITAVYHYSDADGNREYYANVTYNISGTTYTYWRGGLGCDNNTIAIWNFDTLTDYCNRGDRALTLHNGTILTGQGLLGSNTYLLKERFSTNNTYFNSSSSSFLLAINTSDFTILQVFRPFNLTARQRNGVSNNLMYTYYFGTGTNYISGYIGLSANTTTATERFSCRINNGTTTTVVNSSMNVLNNNFYFGACRYVRTTGNFSVLVGSENGSIDIQSTTAQANITFVGIDDTNSFTIGENPTNVVSGGQGFTGIIDYFSVHNDSPSYDILRSYSVRAFSQNWTINMSRLIVGSRISAIIASCDVTGDCGNISTNSVAIYSSNNEPNISNLRTINTSNGLIFAPEQYTNVTLRAQVTDFDVIQWCNFTMQLPDLTLAINNSNGTRESGSFWNTSRLTFNTTRLGQHYWNVTCYDGTFNTTAEQLFNISIAPAIIVLPLSVNFSVNEVGDDLNYTYLIYSNRPELDLNVTLANGSFGNTGINITLNETNFLLTNYNSSNPKKVFVNISTGSDLVNGTYSLLVNITAINFSGNLNQTNVTVQVFPPSAELIFLNNSDVVCEDPICNIRLDITPVDSDVKIFTIKNTGNRTAVAINLSMTDDFIGWEWWSIIPGGTFNLSPQSNRTVTVLINRPEQGLYTGFVQAVYEATVNRTIATTSTNAEPYYYLNVTASSPPAGPALGGSAGGGGTTTIVEKIVEKVKEAVAEPIGAKFIIGDGICDGLLGENFFSGFNEKKDLPFKNRFNRDCPLSIANLFALIKSRFFFALLGGTLIIAIILGRRKKKKKGRT